MFTGIVEETGRIVRFDRKAGGGRIEIEADLILDGTVPGHSIAVNGVCLTVEDTRPGLFGAFLSAETMEKTTFSRARTGDGVNLERALAFGGRLGGHLVTGHVEATGRIDDLRKEGDGYLLAVSGPASFAPYLVEKGSVSVDGVSLTLAGTETGWFTVALIPETFEKTTFRLKRMGDFVNLEPDLILKYVMSSIRELAEPGEPGGVTLQKLKNSGFITD
jgi:riboflavin synthase